MRQLALSTIVVFGSLVLASTASGQCNPGVLACTDEEALGVLGAYDDTVSDITFRSTQQEVWSIEGPLPGRNNLQISRITVFNDDLRTNRRSFNTGFSQPAFGIAEIPSHLSFADKFYVLTPGVFTGPLRINLAPQIGIMDAVGNLIPEPEGTFAPVLDETTGLPPPGFFSALDVHPSEQELVLLNDGRTGGGAFFLFASVRDNDRYKVKRGPFPVEGLPTFFGAGIAYNTAETVLVVSQFRSSFEARLAMEYDRQSGAYTGRTVVLDPVASGDTPIALALDTGFVGRTPALFTYNAFTDAVYAVPQDLIDAPGPVHDLNPACALDPDGKAHLTWTNPAAFNYDQILVFENGVLVASLGRNDTEYISSSPLPGKYEFCLETRLAGEPNEIRVCCEGQNEARLSFLPAADPVAVRVDVDPLAGLAHLPLGVACPAVVENKDDFRLYMIGTYDNQVRVFDYRRQALPAETIPTTPTVLTTIQNGAFQNFAATGIALIDVTMDGHPVPMYALLDVDGADGNSVSSASVHFLKDAALPGGLAPKGSLFQSIPQIDFSGIGDGGRLIFDWDSDAAGDLISLDTEGLRILKIHYDPSSTAMRAVQSAPLPLRDLTPFTNREFPISDISVLPNGNYLILGGDTFDSTFNRAFVVTPLSDDLERSAKLVGHVEGLFSFSQLFSYGLIGRALGPNFGVGLETCFFKNEGDDQKGVGAAFYNLLDFVASPGRAFLGNFVVAATASAANPDLAAEPLFDQTTTLGVLAPLDTGPLSPSFAALTPALDFHYHVFNTSPLSDLRVKLTVFLDDVEVPSLGVPEAVIFPGRSLYRTAQGRAEKGFRLKLQNLGTEAAGTRVLVGATGIKSAVPPEVFRRGDTDGDGGVNLTDPIFVLQFLFLAGDKPRCPDSADVDDLGTVELTDAVYLLGFMFQAGPPPPAPGPQNCGPDTVDDGLEPCDYRC